MIPRAQEFKETAEDAAEEERAAIMAWIRAQRCEHAFSETSRLSVLDCGDGWTCDRCDEENFCACYAYQSVAEMIRGRGTETKETR